MIEKLILILLAFMTGVYFHDIRLIARKLDEITRELKTANRNINLVGIGLFGEVATHDDERQRFRT